MTMNMNLCRSLDNPPRCSPPQTPLFSFYNRENTTKLFDSGDTIELFCQAGFRQGSGLVCTLHHNRILQPIRSGTAEDLPANLYRIALPVQGLRPGFYDVRVRAEGLFPKLHFDGSDVSPEGICTFGWKAEKIPVADTRPPDFRSFWQSALEEYRRIPLDPRTESSPELFRGKDIDEYNRKNASLPGNFDPGGCRYDEVLSWKISFAGPDGRRVFGWAASPAAPGTFPAMLVLPGGGNGKRPRPLDHARHGYFALDLQVHGFDPDADEYPEVPGYLTPPYVFFPLEKSRWHKIYLRAVRAVDFLAQCPQVDATKIVTIGGSQGGRLAVVVPALDPRIAATVPALTHGGCHPRLVQVCKCNALPVPDCAAEDDFSSEQATNGENIPDPPPMPETESARSYRYYDPMNFGPDLHCPVYFNAGLIDPVSPPYATWQVFQRIASRDKTFVPLPGLAHDWSASFDRAAYHWLRTKLNPESPEATFPPSTGRIFPGINPA